MIVFTVLHKLLRDWDYEFFALLTNLEKVHTHPVCVILQSNDPKIKSWRYIFSTVQRRITLGQIGKNTLFTQEVFYVVW